MDGKIFNLFQADKFLKAGATAIGIDKAESRTIYVLFETNDKFYELMDKWIKRQPLI